MPVHAHAELAFAHDFRGIVWTVNLKSKPFAVEATSLGGAPDCLNIRDRLVLGFSDPCFLLSFNVFGLDARGSPLPSACARAGELGSRHVAMKCESLPGEWGAGETKWGGGVSSGSIPLHLAVTVLLHPLVLSFPISLPQLPIPRTQPAY